jgi:hypothetical protein
LTTFIIARLGRGINRQNYEDINVLKYTLFILAATKQKFGVHNKIYNKKIKKDKTGEV